MEIIYSWLAIAMLCVMIELLSATFYGFSVALAATVTAIYAYFSGENEFSLIQASIFFVASGFFAYFLPKILVSHAPDLPQWADRYVGEKRSVKKAWGDLKISLDGVDYLIEWDDTIVAGDKVIVTEHKGVSMIAKKQ